MVIVREITLQKDYQKLEFGELYFDKVEQFKYLATVINNSNGKTDSNNI